MKQISIAVALISAASLPVGWLVWKCDRDPRINFLPRDIRAEWIIFPAPIDARIHRVATMDATFRRTFSLESKPETVRLLARAAKRLELKINGEIVPISPTRNWKEIFTADASKFLRNGENTIEARVFNDAAPPALWLFLKADSSNLRTDAGWQASIADSSWRNCALASVAREPGAGNPLSGGEKIPEVLPQIWAVWIVFAAVAGLLMIAITRWLKPNGDVDLTRREILILLGICALAWAVLFCNNTRLLPFHSGYDSKDHIAYIKYIQDRRALPLPNEGYEMFQPPLYYALSAGLLSICRLTVSDQASVAVLRGMTMIFGIGDFVFVFLSARLLFPRQRCAQIVALLTAAFLPMQLYLSHYVTNETLAATLVSGAIYFALRVLKSQDPSAWLFLTLGIFTGAAMLTKATSVLLLLPLFGAIVMNLVQERAQISHWLRLPGITIGATFAVCGWHYLRIWRHFGKPIVGNWEAALGFPWWQDPGFHTSGDYLRFGRALFAPLYSGFNGFADGIYSTVWGDSLCGGLSGVLSRTPWNYSLIIAGYWFALIPTLLIVTGIAVALIRFVRKPSPLWFLLIGFSAAVAVAVVFMTVRVASYAQIKAFYGLSAIVPLSCFAAIGWQIVTARSRVAESLVGAAIIFFGINSFASVAIRPSSRQHIYSAGRLMAQSQPALAFSEAAAAVKSDPSSVSASYIFATILDQTGETTKAAAESERGLQLDESNGESHFQLGVSLAKQGELTRAMSEAQRALDMIPENAHAHDLLLALDRQLQRYDDMLAAARDALAMSPFDADLHYRVGLAAGQAGDFMMAANQFAYAFLLDPTTPEPGQKLRLALSFLQQRSDAKNTIRDLQSLAAGSPKLLEILAAYEQSPNSNP